METGISVITSSAVIVYIQRWCKQFNWYKLFIEKVPIADKYLHRAIAGIASFIAAIGIHITFDGDMNTGWKVAGFIPDVWTMIHGTWEFISVFALQQYMYDSSKSTLPNLIRNQ